MLYIMAQFVSFDIYSICSLMTCYNFNYSSNVTTDAIGQVSQRVSSCKCVTISHCCPVGPPGNRKAGLGVGSAVPRGPGRGVACVDRRQQLLDQQTGLAHEVIVVRPPHVHGHQAAVAVVAVPAALDGRGHGERAVGALALRHAGGRTRVQIRPGARCFGGTLIDELDFQR